MVFFRLVDLVNRRRVAMPTGIIEGQVQSAKLADTAFDRRAAGLALCNVARVDHRPCPQSLDLARDCRKRAFTPPDKQKIRPFARHGQCGSPAHAAAGAGDKSNLASELA